MIELRQAQTNDAAELARIQVNSWMEFSHIFSPAYMEKHNTFERRFFYWMGLLERNIDRTYLIELDGLSIGYVTIGFPREDNALPGALELTALYLKRSYMGQGYGAYVMRRLFTSIKAAGYDRLTLWVLKKNHRAIRFYQHLGFTFDEIEMTLPTQGAIFQTRMSRVL